MSLAPLAGRGWGEGPFFEFGLDRFENPIEVDDIVVPEADHAITKGAELAVALARLRGGPRAGRHRVRRSSAGLDKRSRRSTGQSALGGRTCSRQVAGFGCVTITRIPLASERAATVVPAPRAFRSCPATLRSFRLGGLPLTPTLPASGARESIGRAGGSPSRCWCSVNLGLRASLIPRLAALAALVLERLGRIETVEARTSCECKCRNFMGVGPCSATLIFALALSGLSSPRPDAPPPAPLAPT